jgi:hypothetical protein
MAELPDDAKKPATEAAAGNENNINSTPNDFASSFQYRERVSDICNMHDRGWLTDDNDLSEEAVGAVEQLARDSGKTVASVEADVYEAAQGVDEANLADDEDKYGHLNEYGEPLPPLGDLNNNFGDDDDWDDSRVV